MDKEQTKKTVEIVNSLLNDELFQSGVNTLVKTYYNNMITTVGMDIEDKFQLVTSILLSEFRHCLEEQEYELMDEIQKAFKGLYTRTYARSKKVSRKLKIFFSNDFWDKQVQLMLDNKTD